MFAAHAAAPSCDPASLRVQAETAVAEARLDDAAAALEAANQALGCARVSHDELARLHLVHGALLLLRDHDPAGAAFAFGAARALDASATPDLGDEVRRAWEEIEVERGHEVFVTLVGVPEAWVTLVDSRPTTGALSVAAGLHVFQVEDLSGAVRWGELTLVERPLTLRLPAFAGPEALVVPPGDTHADRALARVVGGALVLLGGASAALTVPFHAAQQDAADLGTLRAARDRQVGFGAAGLALGGAGAVLLGASFAF